MRNNTKIALCGIAAGFFLGGCKDPYCVNNVDDPVCRLNFKLISPPIKGKDYSINIKAENIRDNKALMASFTQQGKTYPLTIARLQSENDYQLGLPPEVKDFKGLRLGNLAVTLKEGDRSFTDNVRLIKPLSYSNPAIFTSQTVAKGKQPVLEFMELGKDIFGLVSGISVSGDVRSVRRYTFGSSGLAESTTLEFISSAVSSSALIAVTPSSIFLSDNPNTVPVTAYKCSTAKSPIMESDCKPLGFSLPTGNKSMLVTPDDSRMILADALGNLSWCNLATQQKPPCPNAIAPTGTGVLLTLADLNNDKKQDLLAAWLDSGQLKVGVYLDTGSGFTTAPDPPLSQQLSTALGSSAIEALAAGDIDGDGFDGDVVFARGLKVTLLQSQLDRFESVWSANLDPTKAGPKINVIAVGRLDASSTPDKPMDILASSNTPYDAMDQSTLYIHVFRPQ